MREVCAIYVTHDVFECAGCLIYIYYMYMVLSLYLHISFCLCACVTGGGVQM